MDDPILIVGTHRSGTNLVARIIDMHSRIRVPYPLHLMETLAGLEPTYSDLDDDRNTRLLIRDVRLLALKHTVPWCWVPSEDEIMAALPQRTVFGVMAALWDLDTRKAGKRRWCDRSVGMINHVGAVRSVYPKARVIWLVRDPRDVTVSARTSVFLPFHPELTARLWQRHQQFGIDLTRTLPPHSLHLLRYEDLIADSETEVRRLCAFLGEEYEPAMLRYADDAESVRLAGLSSSWENLRKPVLASNAGKYASRLVPRDIAAVERICAPAMRYLGYPAHDPAVRTVVNVDGWAHALRIFFLNQVLRVRAEAQSLRRDRSHWARWRRTFLNTWITCRQRLHGFARRRQPTLSEN